MGFLKEKYTRDYFLGAVDNTTKKVYGVAGFEAFKQGNLDPRYRRFLRHLPIGGKRILDIGCGRGEIVNYCARAGAKRAVGLDFSPEAIQIAAELNRDCPTAELVEMEAADIRFENAFDVIFMLDVVEHIPDAEMQTVYERVHAALSRDGMLLVHTPLFSSREERDRSDVIPSVCGMHCNKQTRETLSADLRKHGFRRYSTNVWGKAPAFSVAVFGYVVMQAFDAFVEAVPAFLGRWGGRALHPVRTMRHALRRLGLSAAAAPDRA